MDLVDLKGKLVFLSPFFSLPKIYPKHKYNPFPSNFLYLSTISPLPNTILRGIPVHKTLTL
uniref:Uncharacterized protein n=1 Tax=Rhizophora mucronata TaxID=61149 RepID=A0A2P2MXR2_RHIMU